MPNEQIQEYIKNCRAKGIDDQAILSQLVHAGWPENEVKQALGFVMAKEHIQQMEQKKKRGLGKWGKRILILIGVIVLLAVLVYLIPTFLSIFFGQDDPPPNDADIRLTKVTVPDGQNSFFDLVAAAEVLQDIEDLNELDLYNLAIYKNRWDQDAVDRMVAVNQEMLVLFTTASQKSKYQDPNQADPAKYSGDTILTPLNIIRSLSRISSLQAVNFAKQGAIEEAVAETFKSIAVGDQMQHTQAGIIYYLVGEAIKDYGLFTLQKIVRDNVVPSELKSSVISKLNQYSENLEGIQTALKAEYYFQINTVDMIANDIEGYIDYMEKQNPQDLEEGIRYNYQKIKNNYYFKPNQTKNLLAEFARKNMDSGNDKCGLEERNLQIPSPTFLKAIFMENVVGKMFYNVVAIDLRSIHTKKCQQDFLIDATQATYAIYAYLQDNGQFPQSLNALVPIYLDAIPTDPFNDKPARYDLNKKIIYSVGKDLQDSGGLRDNSSWYQSSDLVVEF